MAAWEGEVRSNRMPRMPIFRSAPWSPRWLSLASLVFAVAGVAGGCVRRASEAEARAAGSGPVAAPAPAPTPASAAAQAADRNAELAAIAERERAAIARPPEPAAPAPDAEPTSGQIMSLPPADEAAAAAKRAEIERRAAALPVPEVGDLVPNMAPNDIVRENLRAVRAPGERRFEGPDQLIRRVRHAAANRDLQALSRYMTPRLAASTAENVSKHEERFWAHMARYVTAGSQGFKMETSPGQDKDMLQLIISVEPDIVLRPIVQRREDGWYFDRF